MEELLKTPVASLLGDARLRNYPKGQILLYEDDQPTDVYILKEGAVSIYDIDDQGNEKVLHILRAPSIFPLALYLGIRREVGMFYGALTDVEVYLLPYTDFETKCKVDPKLGIFALNRVVQEMQELLVRLSSMGKTTAYGKLTAALKFLGVHHAEERRGGWRRVNFPVSHQLLADMTGVTRESVTLTIGQLQEEKLIRYPKQTMLEIHFPKLIKT